MRLTAAPRGAIVATGDGSDGDSTDEVYFDSVPESTLMRG
jgi:hypothetical protein